MPQPRCSSSAAAPHPGPAATSSVSWMPTTASTTASVCGTASVETRRSRDTGRSRNGDRRRGYTPTCDPTAGSDMAYEHLLVERQGPVGWLINNRPDQLNAMNGAMREEFADACIHLARDPDVR